MTELLRTNDLVLLGLLEGLLEAEGIPALVVDRHISGMEGGIGLFPRRILVPEEWLPRARRFLVEAGFGSELSER